MSKQAVFYPEMMPSEDVALKVGNIVKESGYDDPGRYVSYSISATRYEVGLLHQ
jgi:hypothetical protein